MAKEDTASLQTQLQKKKKENLMLTVLCPALVAASPTLAW